METTWDCTPNCFASSPTTTIGSFNANMPGTAVDQIEFNCAPAGVTGLAIAFGKIVRYERHDVTVSTWSSDSVAGPVGFYCPFIPTDSVGFSP